MSRRYTFVRITDAFFYILMVQFVQPQYLTCQFGSFYPQELLSVLKFRPAPVKNMMVDVLNEISRQCRFRCVCRNDFALDSRPWGMSRVMVVVPAGMGPRSFLHSLTHEFAPALWAATALASVLVAAGLLALAAARQAAEG